ncbi:hypothetical protein [Actinoplanes sp. N902-109]|uniref:hypothetical protein n=1 Tax=Actinoplanes sp. (strain N902-109) TaxID=649831 RepID=UPI00032955C1|nr:hypothetical protein [Actinoplanes sp. N902-109]AGL21465.1 hypothetical protein L083_7955 [Actinoplanes sp. N902-109]
MEGTEEDASVDQGDEGNDDAHRRAEMRSPSTRRRPRAPSNVFSVLADVSSSAFSVLGGLPVLSPAQRIAWHDSEARKRVMRVGWWLAGCTPVACFLVGWITNWFQKDIEGASARDSLSAAFVAAGVTAALTVYLILFGFPLYRRLQYRVFIDRIQLEEAKTKVADAESRLAESEGGELALSSLWGVTAKRLDYYHEIATQQANASFARAQAATIIGFGILILSLIFSLFAKSTTSSISISVVGGLAAALGGYVGRTFIKSQETASGNLKGYFMQPLELSRFLLAERLLQELPTDRRPDGVLMILEGMTRSSASPSVDVEKPS